MKTLLPIRSFIALSLVAFAGLRAVEPAVAPEVDPKDLPRLPAVPADQALATFKLRPGLKLERVAAEPLVRDPIEV